MLYNKRGGYLKREENRDMSDQVGKYLDPVIVSKIVGTMVERFRSINRTGPRPCDGIIAKQG